MDAVAYQASFDKEQLALLCANYDRRIDSIGAENKRLNVENAKLRELLQDLAICACGKYCYGCPHQYDGCDRDQRLRELGVEP